MVSELHVALIGYGFAASTFHAPVITSVPGFKLSKVLQRNSVSSKERFPWVEVVEHAQDIYNDENIDVVVVTTPNSNHYDFAKDSLMAGKHVIVEKPFTTTTAEADELVSIAKQKGKILSVFHNRRWDGDFLTLRQLINQRLLGRLTDVEFCWDRYIPTECPELNWRNSGNLGSGVFFDLGVHLIDQALTLFGMPKTISSDIRTIRDNAIADDYFDVILGYESELRVRLKSSMLVREQGPRYTLHGTQGSFMKYGIDPQEEALIKGGDPLHPDWGADSEHNWGVLNTSINGIHFVGRIQTVRGSYTSFYKNVYDAIFSQAELEVKPEQARMAIRLIELGMKSKREGKIIKIPVSD